MAEPISEQIAAVVKTRLETISTGSGFETTASGVNRPTRLEGQHPDDFQITILQQVETHNEALSCPGNPPLHAWDLIFEITGELRPSETDTVAVDTYKNRFAADVQKAITSPTNWQTFGGLAINATLTAINPKDGESPAFGSILLINYRTPENDPYTSA